MGSGEGNEGIGKGVGQGAGLEGRCWSDWRERRLSEQDRKGEKRVILSQEWGRKRGDQKRGRRGVGLEGGCRSDWREWRLSK